MRARWGPQAASVRSVRKNKLARVMHPSRAQARRTKGSTASSHRSARATTCWLVAGVFLWYQGVSLPRQIRIPQSCATDVNAVWFLGKTRLTGAEIGRAHV